MNGVKRKIVFRLEVEENEFGGLTWKTTILGQKGEMNLNFANKIYDDLGIEVEHLDYETNQEILD